MKKPTAEHFFVPDDGALYDTRKIGWYNLKPVRPVYKRTFRVIENNIQLKATLRAGAAAWPGGYPLFFVTDDGSALSFETVKAEIRSVLSATKGNGWKVVGCQVNWEDEELTDDHTGEPIESAYGERVAA